MPPVERLAEAIPDPAIPVTKPGANARTATLDALNEFSQVLADKARVDAERRARVGKLIAYHASQVLHYAGSMRPEAGQSFPSLNWVQARWHDMQAQALRTLLEHDPDAADWYVREAILRGLATPE
jgi:hypothetical protein